jgi:peptide/nickel transport system ATP-binding protein
MKPVIEIKNLAKYFNSAAGKNLAVDGVSFKIEKGRTMGVVGESGCGKSTLGRTIIRLYEPTDGQILLNGEDITYAKGGRLKKVRENMQIIFQDPYSSLNPRMSVEETIREPLEISGKYRSRKEMADAVSLLFERVGIANRYRASYPHEMDGGRRQRVGIARAIALNPDFVMCDEPVSALDVSIQAQVLNLLMDLQRQAGLTYMFITHDLSVVKHISDHISVMYLGQLVETCASRELIGNPLHPYTKVLLSAIPSIDIHRPTQRQILKGELTSAINPKPGCRFAPRCEYASDMCGKPQSLEEVATDHFVACGRIHEIG